MFKQFLIILILSMVLTFFGKEFNTLLVSLGHWQASLINSTMSYLPWSNRLFLSEIFVLAILPFFIGLIPAFFYWLAERKEMPHLVLAIWIVWIISTLVFIINH